MKRPLFCFAICFSISLAILQYASGGLLLIVGATSALAAVAAAVFFPRLICRLPFAAVLAVVLSCGLLFMWSYCTISPLKYFDDRPAQVTGYLTDLETNTKYGFKYTMRAESLKSGEETYSEPFKIVIYTNEPISNAQPCERITLDMILSLPDTAEYEGDFDSRKYLRSKGIYLEGTLKSELLLENSHKQCGTLLERSAYKIKRYATDTLFSSKQLSYDNAALTCAITMNYKGRLSNVQRASFAAIGLSHIAAASGMHVSILAFGVLLLLHMLKVRKKYSMTICVAAIVMFAAVAGFSVSIIRSGVMFLIMALAYIFDRSYDSYTSLGFACILILVQNPYAIDDVGFILSATSTLGILTFDRPLRKALIIRRDGISFGILNYFLGLISLTLAATALSVPFNMFIFGGLSLISPLSNVLVVPLLPVIFILFLIICMTAPFSIDAPFAYLLNTVCDYISSVSGALAELPMSYLITDDKMYVIWLAFAIAVVMICYASKNRIPRTGAVCLILVSFLCVGAVAGDKLPERDSEGFRLIVMDVGQGQCALLLSGDYNIMIDCGSSSSNRDVGLEIPMFLKRNGIYSIDALIVSHYHDDHTNAARQVMSQIKVKQLFMPDIDDGSAVKSALAEAASAKGCKITNVDRNMAIDTGEAKITLITDCMYRPIVTSDANENNLVVRADYNDTSALIMGDLEEEDEGYLTECGFAECDVLLVAHHGSSTSSCEYFLNCATPELSVISVGRDNSYGHPTEDTLERLSKYSAAVFRTDTDGSVVIDASDGGKLKCTLKK